VQRGVQKQHVLATPATSPRVLQCVRECMATHELAVFIYIYLYIYVIQIYTQVKGGRHHGWCRGNASSTPATSLRVLICVCQFVATHELTVYIHIYIHIRTSIRTHSMHIYIYIYIYMNKCKYIHRSKGEVQRVMQRQRALATPATSLWVRAPFRNQAHALRKSYQPSSRGWGRNSQKSDRYLICNVEWLKSWLLRNSSKSCRGSSEG